MNSDAYSPETNSSYAAFAASAALVAICASLLKGPGFDEFWTMYFTDPQLSLQTAFNLWSADTGHPIGFYSIASLFSPLLGENHILLRLVNLPFLLLLLFVCRPRGASLISFGPLFALTFLGGYIALERFAEHRASFPAMALLGALIVGLYGRVTLAASWRVSSTLCLTLMSVAIALLDYMVFLFSFAALASGGLSLILTQGMRRGAVLAIPITASWVAVAISLANGLRFEALQAPYHQSFAGLWEDLFKIIVVISLGNIAVLAAALDSAKIRNLRSPSRLWAELHSGGATSWLLLAFLASVGGMALLNLLAPVVIARQLVGLAPIGSALIASAALLRIKPRWAWSGFLLSSIGVLFALKLNPGIATPAKRMAARQTACASARIYVIDPREVSQPAYNRAVQQRSITVQRAYRLIGKAEGLRFVPEGAPRALEGPCGTFVWIDHLFFSEKPPADQLLRDLGFAGASAAKTSFDVSYNPTVGSLLIEATARNSRR